MNLLLISRLLGIIALLTGGSMLFSLPWAAGGGPREGQGLFGLISSMAVCLSVGTLFLYVGRNGRGLLYRREAMAVVGLSWMLATVLGACPYLLSGTYRAPHVRMNVADAIFESQSGFSTTGATVLTDLEDPELVPRTILFWRSTTHFLGGLGIIVLFVAILGQGSAGKALMRVEMPGPSQDSPQSRMQQTAWVLFCIYAALNVLLALLLRVEGLMWFDALCHAFGTMATGGFSTYNASIGHFAADPNVNGEAIEATILVFMILAGTNFMLLYYLILRRPGKLLANIEWRVYIAVLFGITILVGLLGMRSGEFKDVHLALRYGAFQVVSIMTTTGFSTANFDAWNSFGRGVLFLLMFVGGCAGSTGGGLKVIRHVLFLKVLWLEIERAFHPSVVRPVRLGGDVVENPDLRRNILVYFALILVIFVFSWMAVVTLEPDSTWTDQGRPIGDKLIDSASGVAATLNNIGPGLGTVGATQNYSRFSPWTKLLFTWLMMIGRLEIFAVVVLFVPSFWRSQ